MKVTKKTKLIILCSKFFLTLNKIIIGAAAKRMRRFWVRPINRKRNLEGAFFSLVKEMQISEHDFEQFFKYTRMSPNLFKKLVSLVGPMIRKVERETTLTPEHRLIMTLQ